MSDVIYGIFEWDDAKARRNLREQGISFTEAVTVFDDPFLVVYSSEDSSMEERHHAATVY
jgi:uncharacterized protein